jgi:hypothetical protein
MLLLGLIHTQKKLGLITQDTIRNIAKAYITHVGIDYRRITQFGQKIQSINA